jgi:hypothetical protein
VTVTPPRSAAAWICRRWVGLYTLGLPDAEVQRRRDEIESDLFEHAVEAHQAGVSKQRLNAEVLARVLVGASADLSWRRATRQPRARLAIRGVHMPLATSTTNKLLYGLAGVIIAWVLFWTIGAIFVFESSPENEVSWQLTTLFFAVPLITTAMLAAGLAIRSKSPRRGLHLIVAGAIGPAIWLWFLPIYVPFMIATIALAVSATPRKQARPAAT